PSIIVLFAQLLSSFALLLFYKAPATTDIYTLSLHDALPISAARPPRPSLRRATCARCLQGNRHPAGSHRRRACRSFRATWESSRSEEHTSELQSRGHLVCRLLLEKKKKVTSATHCVFR